MDVSCSTVFITALIWLLACRSAHAVKWNANSVPNGAKLTACVGGDLDILWGFEVNPGDNLVNTEWYFTPRQGHEGLIANKGQTFFTPDDALVKVRYANNDTWNAGIVLTNVTAQYSGTVSVRVNTDHESTIGIVRPRTVEVGVVDAPTLSSGGFKADVVADTIDNTTPAQFHLRLSCGTFNHLGNPPVTVQWRTPDNKTLPSTSSNNGVFHLDIDIAHPMGNYSCFVSPESLPLKCVPSDSPLRKEVTVAVDESQLRQKLLEAQLSSVTQQNHNLTQLVNEAMGQVALVMQANNGLIAQLSALTATQNLLKMQNQLLLGVVSNLTNDVTHLKADNALLQQQNAQLTEQMTNMTDMQDFVQLPQNCQDVQLYNSTTGQRTLFTRGRVYHAYCDQNTDGGGWTVIQRREDGSEDFFRGWKDYENGFGDVTGEHWIGLEKLHLLTSSNDYRLRVALTDFDGSTAVAEYAQFRVDDADKDYSLHVSGYSGQAGDSLRLNNNLPFTTRDKDHDLSTDNCAIADHGAFWYGDCSNANPNGRYYGASAAAAAAAGDDGVYWYDWKRATRSLQRVVMMVKAV